MLSATYYAQNYGRKPSIGTEDDLYTYVCTTLEVWVGNHVFMSLQVHTLFSQKFVKNLCFNVEMQVEFNIRTFFKKLTGGLRFGVT